MSTHPLPPAAGISAPPPAASTEPASGQPIDPSNAAEHFGNLDRLKLLIGALIAYGLFRAAGSLVRTPLVPKISASLLQDGQILGLIVIGLTFLLSTAIATVVAGRFRFEAGLFCAALGLIALPTRGGDIRNALLNADGSGRVFWVLLAELVLLSGIIYAAFLVQNRVRRRPPAVAPVNDPDTFRDRAIVVITQAATTLVILLFLGQSPLKGQALVGVGLAAVLASLMNALTYKVRGSLWYVLGTLLAGVVSYAWTIAIGAPGSEIAEVRGAVAGAARSLPLHYASLGVAGAIYGYWIGMVWIGHSKETAQHPRSQSTVAR